MRASGFLPSRVDQLSMTTEGKSVTNVSWLFDHLVSLSWMLAGEKGLTLLKVFVAGLSAFFLVRISIPGVSTWWSSICTVFAVVACSSDFMPLPELITILGMTLTMRFLFQHRMGKGVGLTWKLPLLLAVWCNFDPRAWVGAGVVVVYSLGSWLSGKLAARKQTLAAASDQQSLVVPALLSVLALMVNPFHVNSLLGPLTTYSIEYPAMQAQRTLDTAAAASSFDGRVDYYSTINPAAFVRFDHSQIAALALLLMALVVLGLARSTRDLGFLAAILFVMCLVVLAAHELPAAAIVAAVVAGVSAQDWYRRSFSMKYSTDTSELLLSRGGRAVTVLALALIGFCVVASRLPGAIPLGFGFDKETRITMETFRDQVATLNSDARILHTRIEQGDLLIWNGRKSFVDSRILPFGRPGDSESVFGKHSNILNTLLHPGPEPAIPPSDPQEKQKLENEKLQAIADAREALSEYRITHVMSRLAPPGQPDYTSMLNLSATGEWVPVSIGASAAIIERVAPGLSEVEMRRKVPSFPKIAFQTTELSPSGLRQFVSPPGFYEKHVYRSRPVTDSNKRMASHYLFLAGGQPRSLEEAFSSLAALTLVVRHLNLSLAERSDDAEAYEMLGRAYKNLAIIEQLVSGPASSERLKQVRYMQAVIAFRQATIIDPTHIGSWENLLLTYQQLNRIDLASEALNQWLVLAEKNPPGKGDEFEEFLTQRFVAKREYEDQIQQSDERIEESVKQQAQQAEAAADADEKSKVPEVGEAEAKEPSEAEAREASLAILSAVVANANGRPRKALDGLRENFEVVRSSPFATILFGQLLLEVGDLEEGHRTLAGLSQEALRQPKAFVEAEWQLPTAISQLGIGDYASAVETWSSQLGVMNKQVTAPQLYNGALFSMPMVADVNFVVNDTLPVWPFRAGLAMTETVHTANELRAEVSLLVAIAGLEQGNLKDAKVVLGRILSEYGETRSRSLAAVYYSMMDDKAEAFMTQNSANTWEEFEYPGEVLPAVPDSAPGSPAPPGASTTPGTGLPGAVP